MELETPMWFRMVWVALQLTWPYMLMPWRSPLLRWRIETYGILDAHGHLLHAREITARDFLTFLMQRRRALFRFLRWAASL